MLKVTTDRRAVRTKKLIRNALSELIEEKGFNSISVIDLTTRADINRGTFYLHYVDKYDMLEKIENEVIQELIDRITNVISIDVKNIDSTAQHMPFMIKVFEYVKENSLFMKAILGPKGDPLFHVKLKHLIQTNLFEKNLVKTFNQEHMLIPETYFISYVLSAHLGIIQQWVKSGTKESPEEMASILSKMFILGPFKVAGIQERRV